MPRWRRGPRRRRSAPPSAAIVAYETRALPRAGKKTGRFSDEDRVDQWLDAFTYNKDAKVAHVLAVVAHNLDLSLGQKAMAYDTIGTTHINTLSDMVTAAIAQDPARFGANLKEFTKRFLFAPLGMTKSRWSDSNPQKVFAYSWTTDVLDMARLGLLLLHRGMWNGKSVLPEESVYRMTHPSFEDANTGYGYLTWLNASSNHVFGGVPGGPAPGPNGKVQGAYASGPCAPVSVYRTHPRRVSA